MLLLLSFIFILNTDLVNRAWKLFISHKPEFCHAGWLLTHILHPLSFSDLARKKSSAK